MHACFRRNQCYHSERETLGGWFRWSSGYPWRPGPLSEHLPRLEPISATLVNRTSKNHRCLPGPSEPNTEASENGYSTWRRPSPNRGGDICSPPHTHRPSDAAAPTAHRIARDASSSLYLDKIHQYHMPRESPRGRPSSSRDRIPPSLSE